jgi:hypothetical protein
VESRERGIILWRSILRKWRQVHHGILDIQICRAHAQYTHATLCGLLYQTCNLLDQTAALIVHVLPYSVQAGFCCAYYDSIHRRATRYLPRSYSTDVSTTPCAVLHFLLKEYGNSELLRALLGVVRCFGSVNSRATIRGQTNSLSV